MKDRPLQNAADEVQALAAEAREALARLQTGWLWLLITRPALSKSDLSKVQPDQSDAT